MGAFCIDLCEKKETPTEPLIRFRFLLGVIDEKDTKLKADELS